ncbi:MAG: hypothetical protein AAF757_17435 [Cyanobacteria bacterium P01_D01_bin.116]
MSKTAEQYNYCPRCKSTNLIRQTGENEPTKQYGRLKCGDCGKHLQWLKDPTPVPALPLSSVRKLSIIY